MRKVAVIGAGASGLCTAKHLLSSTGGTPLFPVVFEQKSSVGGTWIFEHVVEGEQVFSSIYKNLKTNLPKQVMNFPDFPFPDEIPSFMHHTEVRKYLEKYAEMFDIEKTIRFRTKVTHIEPQMSNDANWIGSHWIVRFQNLDDPQEEREEEFDAVVICNGHYSVPYTPIIKGFDNFKGKSLHSHYYRDPEEYRDMVVIVLGFGPSGRDIGLELTDYCSKVYISHRGDRCKSSLPRNLIELVGLVEIDELGRFCFEDGRTVEDVDVFLMCTGYLFDLSFLDIRKIRLNVELGKVIRDLYKHIFFVENPSLCFVGLPWQGTPFPLVHQQSAYIAKIFSGIKTLPSKVDMRINTDKESLSDQPLKYFHKLGSRQFKYSDALAELSGCKKNPVVIERLYDYVARFRRKDVTIYKNMEFRQINDEEFEDVTKSK